MIHLYHNNSILSYELKHIFIMTKIWWSYPFIFSLSTFMWFKLIQGIFIYIINHSCGLARLHNTHSRKMIHKKTSPNLTEDQEKCPLICRWVPHRGFQCSRSHQQHPQLWGWWCIKLSRRQPLCSMCLLMWSSRCQAELVTVGWGSQ